MQISTTSIDRDVALVSGALLAGEPNVVQIVEHLRIGDPDLYEVLEQVRQDVGIDLQQNAAAQRLGATSPETLAAINALQEDKPMLLRSLACLAARANWQELLQAA
ncbi:MAG: hypothetical protein AAF657_39210 [Acidobacteriota bacterium]